MITHFYSDPHFGHHNIIRFSNRPFANVEEMHREMIARYNAVVGPEDFVLWVGDVAMKLKATATRAILDQLNGHRALIRGNHDGTTGKAASLGFSFVTDELFLKIGDRLCRVKHYPYALSASEIARAKKYGEHIDDRYLDRRPPRVPGEVLIHGHTHSSKRRKGNQIHVGVDAWDYAPVAFDEIAKLVALV